MRPRTTRFGFIALAILATLSLGGVADAIVIHAEDFEGIGEGNASDQPGRYTVNNAFNDRTDFFAVEGPGSDPAGPANNGSDILGGSNTRAFGGRDINGPQSPGSPKWVQLDPIDTTGFAGLSLAIDFYGDDGSGNTGQFESGDTIEVLLDFTNDGTFDQTLLTIAGSGGTALSSDADGATASTANTFATTTADITAITTDLVVRIEVSGMTEGSERFVFDNITLSGIPEPTTATLLALTGLALLRRRRRVAA